MGLHGHLFVRGLGYVLRDMIILIRLHYKVLGSDL
jgi:hypothetical protein